jgi:C1A family cysteine protease
MLRASGAPFDEDLAEEAIYWGCKQVDGNWNAGTTFLSADAALSRWGQPIEATWPYDATRSDGTPYHPPVTPGGPDWFQAGLRAVSTTSADVRALLAGSVPAALGITVYSSFFRPDAKGRINDPNPGEARRGRHAVVAVGCDADNILVRNSWGPGWGVDGYGWITNAYVDGHATDVWAIDTSSIAPSSTSATASSHSEGNVYGTA